MQTSYYYRLLLQTYYYRLQGKKPNFIIVILNVFSAFNLSLKMTQQMIIKTAI